MWHYRSPAAIRPGQRPATDTQMMGQIVKCCVADVELRSRLVRFSLGLGLGLGLGLVLWLVFALWLILLDKTPI